MSGARGWWSVRRAAVAVTGAAVLLAGCSTSVEPTAAPVQVGDPSASSAVDPAEPSVPAPTRRGPLAGVRVVLDPGHQLGNARFPEQIGAPVPAGGFTKPCNTTGTSTDAGYPESTFAWRVARLTRARLRDLGARVEMTRHSDSRRRWGPCVDERGRAGNAARPRLRADAKISLHGDGAYGGGPGFHVIRPPDRRPWTHDVVRPSRRLAVALRDELRRHGFVASGYAGTRGIDVRGDLGTLNLSDVPVVMAELGNMRDRRDARVMSSGGGRHRYARALVAGLRTYLGR